MSTTRVLILYVDFTPNVKGGVFYPFSVEEYYHNKCAHSMLTSLQEDSYRFNNGVAIVNIASISQVAKFKNVTYICEVMRDDELSSPVYRYFHVKKFYFQCGKAYFETEPDYFATYWYKCKIPYAAVTRTNVIPDMNTTEHFMCKLPDAKEYMPYPYDSDSLEELSDELTDEQILTIVQIRFVTEADFFGNSPISQTLNFVTTGSPQSNELSVGTIYAVRVKKDEAGGNWEGKAQVVQAWSIPLSFLPDAASLDPGGLWIPRYHDVNNGYAETNWKGGYGYYAYPQSLQHTTEFNIAQDFARRCYVGTRSNMVALPREIPNSYIKVETSLDSNGLRVIMRVGDQSIDMTGAFEMAITYNSDTATTSEKVINGLKTMTNYISGSYKTYEKRGVMGLGYDAYSTFLNQYNYPNPQPAINNGFAQLNFEYDSTNKKYKFPLRLRRVYLVENVKEQVQQEGCETLIHTFNTGSSSDHYDFKSFMLNRLQNCKLIIQGSGTAIDRDRTYIKADVEVSGVISDACKSIKEAFANGMFFKYLNTSA